jgi:hypothetical protein
LESDIRSILNLSDYRISDSEKTMGGSPLAIGQNAAVVAGGRRGKDDRKQNTLAPSGQKKTLPHSLAIGNSSEVLRSGKPVKYDEPWAEPQLNLR